MGKFLVHDSTSDLTYVSDQYDMKYLLHSIFQEFTDPDDNDEVVVQQVSRVIDSLCIGVNRDNWEMIHAASEWLGVRVTSWDGEGWPSSM